MRLLHRESPTEKTENDNSQTAELDKYLLSIKWIDGSVLQIGIRENAVPEQGDGSGIDNEVKRLPQAASESQPEVGGHNDHCKAVQRDGANAVFQRLAGRVYGKKNIPNPETNVRRKQQHGWMDNGRHQQQVPGPVVDAKNIEAMMRPVSPGTVAHGDQRADQKVQRRECNRY